MCGIEITDAEHLTLHIEDGKYVYGGGEKSFLTGDNAVLCFECVRDNREEVDAAIEDGADPQWEVTHLSVNYESENEYCRHCNRTIEPLYGPDPDDMLVDAQGRDENGSEY